MNFKPGQIVAYWTVKRGYYAKIVGSENEIHKCLIYDFNNDEYKEVFCWSLFALTPEQEEDYVMAKLEGRYYIPVQGENNLR